MPENASGNDELRSKGAILCPTTLQRVVEARPACRQLGSCQAE
jgi:hypothetical protein